jgi:integrase
LEILQIAVCKALSALYVSNIGSNIWVVLVAKVAGLIRKKSAYFFVRRIPEGVRPLFGGKQQITRSLNTTDFRVASDRARRAAAETDKAFEDARLGKAPSPQTRGAVTREQLYDAARLHLYNLERRQTEWGDTGPEAAKEIILADLANIGSPHEEVWGSAVQPLADKLLEELGLELVRGDRLWFEFASLIRRAEQEHLERELSRLNGIAGAKAVDALFADTFAHNPQPKLSLPSWQSLGQVITRFENDPTRGHLTESAGKKYILPFAVLREVIGDDKPIGDITRADCASCHELLAALPRSYNKLAEFRDKPLREVAELAKSKGSTLLSQGTVQVYAHHLSAFFNYAAQKGIIDHNPASRLMAGQVKDASSRLPFNSDELKKLFAELPSWSGHRRGRYWVPLLGLLSGMRLGEIVWLHVDDIQTVDGVDAIVLRRTDDRSLKTRGAARVVPIHSELKKLGFMEFVKERRRAGGRLLPDLEGDNQTHCVDLFQKRFSYLLRQKVAVRKGVSFHSFRHGFRDGLRNAGSPIDVTRALGGWARSGGIEERYGQGARPAVLSQWMDKVAYPDLNLSHLRLAKEDGDAA